MTSSTRPITPVFGLEITDTTTEHLLTPAGADEAQRTLHGYGVVVYRQLNISDDDLVTLSRLMGTVVLQPTDEHTHPEIQTITLDPAKTNALLASFRQGNFHWHIDGATDEVPQKGTLLTAREVDPAGGDTEFATTYAAYEALPQNEKDEIESLRVVHSFANAQSLANPDATDRERASWDRVPSRVHPLVWRRRNGRKSLLLGATAAEIVGWPIGKGRALLDRLQDWCTQPRFTLRHAWCKGDLVMWDNTAMLHRALPFEPTSVRLLHRTTLLGEEPVALTAC